MAGVRQPSRNIRHQRESKFQARLVGENILSITTVSDAAADFFSCFVFQSRANCYLGSLILYSTAFWMLSSGPSFRGSRGASFASILSKSVTDEPRCAWTGTTKRRGTILTHRISEYSSA